VALFEGTLREAIHRFKYSNRPSLAIPLGRLMACYWDEHPIPSDVIVPVPLHLQRLRERGYNQAALLAQELSKSTGLPLWDGALKRVRQTRPQVELSAEERRENVKGAFLCLERRVQGKRVLLVDDVCTTGATLEACSEALRAGGARSVWGFTLARPR